MLLFPSHMRQLYPWDKIKLTFTHLLDLTKLPDIRKIIGIGLTKNWGSQYSEYMQNLDATEVYFSVRKVSFFFNLVDFNEARFIEATLNLHKHT